jgi:serine phosphatase RsbU (regulator of sigma subunit)/anti-sigma regulatory factor (Ser/Thr protein kinase)
MTGQRWATDERTTMSKQTQAVSNEKQDVSNEMQDLLQLLYTCPVGLVSFTADGTVVHINPEAVNLIVKTWSLLELRNLMVTFQEVWPDFDKVVNSKAGKPGRLIENHRIVGGTAEFPSAVSMTVVRASSTQYLLAIVDDTSNLAVEHALRQSENRLQTLFDSIDEGYSLCEMITSEGEPIDYRFLKVNPLFEAMTGLVNAAGKTALELVPELEKVWIETYARPALLRESVRFEQGSEAMGRWFDVFATPVEPHGHFAIVFKDQTARRKAENSLQRSASINAFRALLIDTLRTGIPSLELQREAVGLLRDHLDTSRAFYSEIGEKGEIDVSKAQRCRSEVSVLTGQYRLDWQGDELTESFRSGMTIVVGDVGNDPRLSDATRQALHQLNFGSYIMVPLFKQDRLVGAMAVQHAHPHDWTQEEIDLVEETSQRTMLAVEQTNEDEYKRLRYDRAERMAAMLSTMEADLSLDEQALRLANALVPSFADAVTVEVPDANSVVFGTTQSALSLLSVPIDLSRGVRGTLEVARTEPERLSFDAEDMSFFADIATRAGVVMAATRLRLEEHKISIRLQQALLPDEVVWHRNVAIEARYSAASAYMEVGGDWYDTFTWPDGKIGLLVGDVVGHNLESAAQMGRIRAGTAAMAPSSGSSPAAILDSLQSFARGPGGTKFATATCVVIDPETGELTYSSAGHLPVLVITPDGQIQRLDEAITPPICAIDVGTRPEASIKLQPNSLVVMYSDGLIEQRGEGIDEGMTRLESAAVALSDAPIDEFVNRLIAAMTAQSILEDDVVVVCFRFDPIIAKFQRSLLTKVEVLREFRTDLAEWLIQHHPNPDTRTDVLLAVTEACTNAIEHGCLNAPTGSLIVDVSSHQRHLVVNVSDRGTWLPRLSANQDRGRGIAIMQAVSQRFTRTSTTDGTTIEMVFEKAPQTSSDAVAPS